MWWEWMIFAIVLVIVPFSFGYYAVYIKKKRNLSKNEEKALSINIVRYILLYWLCDLFYMSFIIDSIYCKYVFGGCVMLIIFYNLSSNIINHMTIKGNWFIVLDFVIGVGISVYLIYIIPNKDLRTVVLAIVAAVYSGMMTLVGVAWTIKKGDKDRKYDMQRIEQERQEEERRKYRPIFSICGGNEYLNDMPNDVGTTCYFKTTQVECSENKYRFGFFPFYIDNADHVEFFVVGMRFDENFISREKVLIRKNEKKTICFYESCFYHNKDSIEKVELIIEDLLGNRYNINLHYETRTDNNQQRIVVKECDIIK